MVIQHKDFLLRFTHVMAAAHCHVRVAWGHTLRWAGVWQMVIIYTAGVIARDGGDIVKRQVLVQQTAGDTPKKTTFIQNSCSKCLICFMFVFDHGFTTK